MGRVVEMTLEERYESHIDRSGGPDACHPWRLALGRQGYGAISVGTKAEGGAVTRMPTHVGWEIEHGSPVSAGFCVCHHCDNPPCQNPRHWFLGTRADNNADKDAKGRARKVRGTEHPHARLTEDDVRAIRAAGAGAGLRPQARRYGVTHRTIQLILRGEAWAHVE